MSVGDEQDARQIPDAQAPSGSSIIRELKRARVKFVAAVPDIVTSEGLLWPISRDRDLRLIRVCKEDEGVSICAAMSYNGTRAVLLMQQTGLMASLNAVRAIGMDYRLPIVMLVGLQGKEANLEPEESAAYGVRVIRPVLDAMGIQHSLIEAPKSVAGIAEGIERAYEASQPRAFLIGRAPEG